MIEFLGICLFLAASPPVQDPALTEAREAYFDLLGVEQAWDVTQGSADVVVGVIDNGFDFYHPDLVGRLEPGWWYPRSYHDTFFEGIAHGTLVAGLIVANPDAEGTVGLAPDCRVRTAAQGMIEHAMLKLQGQIQREHPEASPAEQQQLLFEHVDELRAFGGRWVRFQLLGAAEAIHWLVDSGVGVINISGGMFLDQSPDADCRRALEEAFGYAAERDCVMVISAGNDARAHQDYPGDPDTTLVVGACLLDGSRWAKEYELAGQTLEQGSSFGPRLSCMAPVENVVLCLPHEKRFYTTDDGPMGPTAVPFLGPWEVRPIGATSCAAPIVSALCALIRSARPDLGVREVVQIVLEGCEDLAEPGPDEFTGHGLVHFGRSLDLALDR